MGKILGQKGNYRLYNDGCATAPYIITIERKKVFKGGFIAVNIPIYHTCPIF